MKVEDLNQEVKDKVMQLLMMHRQRKNQKQLCSQSR